MNNLKEFLVELSDLSRKYGIAIGGCGCCGSPFLSEEAIPDGVIYRYNLGRERGSGSEIELSFYGSRSREEDEKPDWHEWYGTNTKDVIMEIPDEA